MNVSPPVSRVRLESGGFTASAGMAPRRLLSKMGMEPHRFSRTARLGCGVGSVDEAEHRRYREWSRIARQRDYETLPYWRHSLAWGRCSLTWQLPTSNTRGTETPTAVGLMGCSMVLS